MAEYIKASIEIGGDITPKQLKNIMEFAEAWELGIGWDEVEATFENLVETIKAEDLLLCGEGRNGEFEDFEDWLIEEKVPFRRWHDNKYDIDAEVRLFNGSEDRTTLVDDNESPLIHQSTLEKIAQVLADGEAEKAHGEIDDLLFDYGSVPAVRLVVEGEAA